VNSNFDELSDSEDSDEEGGLGNVNRLIIRPAGHSGKAKKGEFPLVLQNPNFQSTLLPGNLCFDAAFETGNLGNVLLVGEFEYDLCLRPDTCNPRHRFWFNFTVDNCKQDQRVIFNIVNMNKSNNLFNQGMTPLVKSTSRPKWQRLPKEHCFYYKSPIHQNHHVLSFAFIFDREDDIYQFALTYPYSYNRLQSYLSVLEQKFPLQRDSLINSVQQRRLELITFDDVKKPEVVEPGKNPIRVIVVIARSHPMESPTSFVVQGLIEFLAIANHPIAKLLRENVVFKIIPMVRRKHFDV
jgi:cytosolic carboxypeptidase protein 6